MLQGKTIQMDADMIADIQKKMILENNFSFQAVTRDYIGIGLEADRWKRDLLDLYVMAREQELEAAPHIEDLLNLLFPEFAETKKQIDEVMKGRQHV